LLLPTQVPGLQLWLDASDASTLYDATTGGSLVAADGAVARWQDKSGNSRHATQATAGARPLRRAAQLNGLDGLEFDGSDDTLRCDALAAFFDGINDEFTILAVAKTDATGSTQDVLAAANSASDDENVRAVWNNGSQKVVLAREEGSPGVTKSAVGATSIGTAAKVAAWVFDGTNGQVFLNGVPDVSATNISHASGITANQVAIGSLPRLNPAVFFNGLIFEIVVYDASLAAEDRSLVEEYLLAKWGIS
jgi:hypothetical protein